MAIMALAVPAIAGPFEDGFAAYQRGDYATAMQLWLPLADQGDAVAQYNLGVLEANWVRPRPGYGWFVHLRLYVAGGAVLEQDVGTGRCRADRMGPAARARFEISRQTQHNRPLGGTRQWKQR